MDVVEHLRRFVHVELLDQANESVGDDDNLLGGGLVDSLGMMRLVAFIETSYEFKVPPEDVTIENFITLGAIGDYIRRRREP